MGSSAALPLVILLTCIILILYYGNVAKTNFRIREGYTDTDTPTPSDPTVISQGQQLYNPLMNLISVFNNPFVGQDPNADQIASAKQDINGALQGTDVKYTDHGSMKVSLQKSPATIPNDTSGMRTYNIQKCEAIKSVDCSAFNDPTFAANCGMCHKPGTDSTGQGHIGGLYIDADTKQAAEMQAAAMGGSPSYVPTIGTCPPGYFTTTQAACQLQLKKQACEQQKNYDIPGCSQCYTGGNFELIDSTVSLADPILFVTWTGKLTVSANGTVVYQQDGGGGTAVSIDISGSSGTEGTAILLVVEPGASSATPTIAGFIQGPSGSSGTQFDLAQLCNTDIQSGITPRMSGELSVGGQVATVLVPGRGQSKMKLQLVIPATFIDPSDPTAQTCPGGSPFLTQPGSATLLGGGACFAAGSGPGNYSMSCLQEKFTDLGCTTSGSGYPNSTATTAALNMSSGAPRALGDIAAYIYEMAVQAATGKTSTGTSLSLTDWNTASLFCTGVSIQTACDAAQVNGVITPDCLADLWNNQGGKQFGQTYTGNIASTSLAKDGSTPQYCTTAGLLSPMSANGSLQAAAIQRALAAGSITDIKSLYDKTHQLANDNSQSDSVRSGAIQDCYGVGVDAWGASPLPQDPTTSTSVAARYVRILPSLLPASAFDQCIQIPQIQIFDTSGNELAKGKPTRSATVYPYSSPTPDKAVDGTLTTRSFPNMYHNACNGTVKGEYWEVDLGATYNIAKFIYYNRSDANNMYFYRAQGMRVILFDKNRNIVAKTQIPSADAIISFGLTVGDTQDVPWQSLV